MSHINDYAALEGAIEGLKEEAYTETLLWKNPNTSASFAAQTVTIPDTSGYDKIVVYTRNVNSENRVASCEMLDVGQGAQVYDYYSLGSGRNRTIKWASNTTVEFEQGSNISAGSSSQNNNACIPIAIIGVKNGIGRISL